jgi:hypothetical protein
MKSIVAFLQQRGDFALVVPDSATDTAPDRIAQNLSEAFLSALGGDDRTSTNATRYLDLMTSDSRWGSVATFYLDGLVRIDEELNELRKVDPARLTHIDALTELLSTTSNSRDPDGLHEAFWAAFFPEGVGIVGNEDQRRDALIERRTVTIGTVATDRVTDPGRQLLLTTNALLTVPTSKISESSVPAGLAIELQLVAAEPQEYWYDHPIPIGVADSQNEILHGLRAMDTAIAFEKERGVVDASIVLPIVMSVSVTHRGLGSLTRDYVRDLLQRTGSLDHLDVFVFTETDVQRLLNEILAPAVSQYLPERDAGVLDVIGVDGPYGRHYSFLKAIAAWWNVMVDPEVIGTYKFDLDQVFPQRVLINETGRSAMEHFTNPLWGSRGTDADGEPIELGMMAGSLVNESDIESSLFTPDVAYPDDHPTIDEMVFWSALPQALSTASEMTTRYEPSHIDGVGSALVRVHITGGTTAIRVDALQRHRPFSPGFIGRAEDQAYLMSVHEHGGPRLGCVHNDGLIMRHDKESFAGDTIRAASIGKLIGDYERIILFSAYAQATTSDVEALKRRFDPFTGCFISELPVTVTCLRFALRALRFFAEDEPTDGCTFTEQGAERIAETISFVSGSPSSLAQQLDDERAAWDLFYDALDAIDDALVSGDQYAIDLVERARTLLNSVVI